ncbi:uncharacterized protein TNCV_329531 [Trichonephila clavipes]|nr:uncharacterized protein TNCV_329531 [Trichonephila clavipes]
MCALCKIRLFHCTYVVLLLYHLIGKGQNEAHEIHHGKGLSCMPVVIRSFEHHTGDSKIWLVSTPKLKGNTLRVVKGLPPTSQEDLWLDGYLEYYHAAKELYICKHPCLIRDSNPGSTAQ